MLRKIKCCFLIIVVVISSFFLCSCILFDTQLPSLYFDDATFENDTWLVWREMLVNKHDGEIYELTYDKDPTIEGMASIYERSHFSRIYNAEFEEDSFKLYSFLVAYYYPEPSKELTYAYFETVFTYDYQGNEIERSYLSDALSEQEYLSCFKQKSNKPYGFSFQIDYYNKDELESDDPIEQNVLKYAADTFEQLDDEFDKTVIGTAKAIDDEIWFSIIVCPYRGFDIDVPFVSGVEKSVIMSYNPESKEFRKVFEYKEKNQAIVDFNKTGFYIYDEDENLNFYHIESKTSTNIHSFSNEKLSLSYFVATEKYIVAKYEAEGRTSGLFVYEKENGIVANKTYYTSFYYA